MEFVIRKCEDTECGAEILVAIDEKDIEQRTYFWKCPFCHKLNEIPVSIAFY